MLPGQGLEPGEKSEVSLLLAGDGRQIFTCCGQQLRIPMLSLNQNLENLSVMPTASCRIYSDNTNKQKRNIRHP
jgi:hypothetical protein